MMSANVHCNLAERIGINPQWIRRHGDQPIGGADYFAVTINADGNEVCLFMSPAQLETLADRLSQAAQDRDVVLAEEGSKVSPVETGGGG